MIRSIAKRSLYGFAYLGIALLLGSCSMGQLVARSSVAIMDSSVAAMNSETDLVLAEAAIPANLKLIEGLIYEAPADADLRIYAAQALYGYAFGFVEDKEPQRASALYRRCFAHTQQALVVHGFAIYLLDAKVQEVEQAIAGLSIDAVPALFWSASCLAKWIDMNRADPLSLAQLGKAAVLMAKVLALQETYYYGGAHIFFGVYYGGLAPMFGGDAERAARHFASARAVTAGKLLIVDTLEAQFLARQQLDRAAFHDKLTAVISATVDDFPEMALANAIAKRKARALLAQEEEWF